MVNENLRLHLSYCPSNNAFKGESSRFFLRFFAGIRNNFLWHGQKPYRSAYAAGFIRIGLPIAAKYA